MNVSPFVLNFLDLGAFEIINILLQPKHEKVLGRHWQALRTVLLGGAKGQTTDTPCYYSRTLEQDL